MLATVERLGVDAAIIFSDLLLILEPMGQELAFTAGEGPQFARPIRSAADVDRLVELESVAPLEYVMETVRRTRAGLPEALPLVGFAGAPFTLAAYAVEGGSSRDYRFTKMLMYSDTGAWDAMMSRLARAIIRYLNAQIRAGRRSCNSSTVGSAVSAKTTIAAMSCPTAVACSRAWSPACRRSILPRAIPHCFRPCARRAAT